MRTSALLLSLALSTACTAGLDATEEGFDEDVDPSWTDMELGEDLGVCIEDEIGTICPYIPPNLTGDFIDCAPGVPPDDIRCKGVCDFKQAFYVIELPPKPYCCDCRGAEPTE